MKPKKVVVLAGFEDAVLQRQHQFDVWGYRPERYEDSACDDPACVVVAGDVAVDLVKRMREAFPETPLMVLAAAGEGLQARLLAAGVQVVLDVRVVSHAVVRERLQQLCARKRGPKPAPSILRKINPFGKQAA